MKINDQEPAQVCQWADSTLLTTNKKVNGYDQFCLAWQSMKLHFVPGSHRIKLTRAVQ